MKIKKMLKEKKIITHNSGFHADDVFACAALSILLEKQGESFEIIRTRDPEIIKTGDFVVDVGGVYDSEKNRFDHHQKGGAGTRPNTIAYSSFGLVWKKFGIELCGGNPRAADIIDNKICQPIDGPDNGISISQPKILGVYDYVIHNLFAALQPTWKEDSRRIDQDFLQALEIAKTIMIREIKNTIDYLEEEKIILETYKNTSDKRSLVFSNPFSRFEIVKIIIENNMPETLFAVYPDKEENDWKVTGIRKSLSDFELRKNLPEAWSGLQNGDLQGVTNVPDAVFCHRNLFLAVAKSKEGAIKLAELALLEPNN